MTPDDAAATRAEALYADDPCSQALGMRIVDTTDYRATVAMTVRDDMVNGHGVCHGGLVFALADSAVAFACSAGGRPAVAATCTTDFVRPVRAGEELAATATERHRGRTTSVFDVAVHVGDGRLVAMARVRVHLLDASA